MYYLIAIELIFLALILRNGFIKDIFFDRYVSNSDGDSWIFWIFTKKSLRLEKLLQEAIDICEQRGFNNLHFTIRFVSRMVLTNRCGSINFRSSRIFMYKSNTSKYSDNDLRILIGHELGHAIYRRGINSHPILGRISKITSNEEEVADMMSIYLYGKDMFLRSYKESYFYSKLADKIDAIEFTRPHLFLPSIKK